MLDPEPRIARRQAGSALAGATRGLEIADDGTDQGIEVTPARGAVGCRTG